MKKAFVIILAALCLCSCAESSSLADAKSSGAADTTTTTSAATTTTTTAVTTSAETTTTKAPEPFKAVSGEIGDNIRWNISDDGVLTVSGKGEIPEMSGGSDHWKQYAANITAIVVEEGITKIGISAFNRCEQAVSVSIPASVIEIDDYAFYNCDSLKEVTIPDTVTKLGIGIFWRCFHLEKAVIGKGIKELPYNTFCRCKRLKDVTMYNGTLERLGDTSFEYCEGIREIYIPESVKEFGFCIFPDDSSRITIQSKKGAPAEAFAAKLKIKFQAV